MPTQFESYKYRQIDLLSILISLMVHYRRRTIAFAVSLAVLAGYVDALGFLSLGGFFVSFMSGNSTRLGVGLGEKHLDQIATALGLILVFVSGVVLGSIVGRKCGVRRRVGVLTTVSILLFLSSAGYEARFHTFGAVAQVLAMGALNAVFERNGEVSIGVTYITGSLVKLGQRIADAFFGGPKWTWTRYASLWLGLVFGASCGTFAYSYGGIRLLWPAGIYAILMAALSSRVP